MNGREPKEPVAGSQDPIKDSEGPERDQVCLSPLGQELQKARSAIEQEPSLRLEKIQELRKLIAGGEYHITDEQLAEKIVDYFLGEC